MKTVTVKQVSEAHCLEPAFEVSSGPHRFIVRHEWVPGWGMAWTANVERVAGAPVAAYSLAECVERALTALRRK